jgi:hypothetical protein
VPAAITIQAEWLGIHFEVTSEGQKLNGAYRGTGSIRPGSLSL